MCSLVGKVTIVTGAANGIGAAIVKEFSKENAKFIAILDIDVKSGTELEKEINSKYGEGKSRFFQCDVTNDEELHGVIDKVAKQFDGIDVIVNNAGLSSEDLSTYKKEIAVNYTATVSSTFKGIELMRVDHGGKGGTVINVSSAAALTLASPFIFIYAGTKSAVLHFSNCIGMEGYYRHTKVRVITLCFSVTDTDIFSKTKGYDKLIDDAMTNIVKANQNTVIMQSAEAAAQGLVHGYKNGNSGSTWLVNSGKVYDISDNVSEAYNVMSKNVKF